MPLRILAEPAAECAYYHVFSRVAGGDFLFGDTEKECFRILLHKLLEFSGLEAVTWCCLGNHFHILLKVPNGQAARAAMSEDTLFSRMEVAFSRQFIREVKWRVEHARKLGNHALAEKIVAGLKAQMFDLPKFMHMLKRRFSTWYNQRHERRGTLWESRYGSVLVEDSDVALRTMACYIDLNPVRAKLVDDPKDYRWCGYAEALAGDERAQRALTGLVSSVSECAWAEAQRAYRCWMFDQAQEVTDEHGQIVRKGIDPEQARETLATGGKLTRGQLLQCRVRYFTQGVAIGAKPFVDGVFQENRSLFGSTRKSGARPMRLGEWNGLCSLRNLRQNVVRPPESATDTGS